MRQIFDLRLFSFSLQISLVSTGIGGNYKPRVKTIEPKAVLMIPHSRAFYYRNTVSPFDKPFEPRSTAILTRQFQFDFVLFLLSLFGRGGKKFRRQYIPTKYSDQKKKRSKKDTKHKIFKIVSFPYSLSSGKKIAKIQFKMKRSLALYSFKNRSTTVYTLNLLLRKEI